MRFLRLCWFHLKLYATDQYFLWLTISSTISLFLVQYVLAYATHNLADTSLWLRSGIFGLWSSATTATGCIGFQRYQGTLPYILNNQLDDRVSLLALILPASCFGLLSFPISYFLAIIFGVGHGNFDLRMVGLIFLFWLSAYVMDVLIAVSFILTTNAIVYEELILIPLLLLSGLFGYPKGLTGILQLFQWLIPISAPMKAILNGTEFNFGAELFSLLLWGTIGWNLATVILRKAKVSGSEGMM